MKLLIFLASLSVAVMEIHGQTPLRLDQLESAYRENLRKAQAPLLQQYLTELKSLLAKSTGSDADAIKFEIARITSVIADGTTIDLVPGSDASRADDSKGSKKRGIVFTLDPEEATPAQPKGEPVPLGVASWTFSRLPAGIYELVGLCACPGPLPAKPVVTITYHGITQTCEVKPENQTKSRTTYRVLPLCKITLSDDVVGERLTVRAEAGAPWLFAKQLHLTKARE